MRGYCLRWYTKTKNDLHVSLIFIAQFAENIEYCLEYYLKSLLTVLIRFGEYWGNVVLELSWFRKTIVTSANAMSLVIFSIVETLIVKRWEYSRNHHLKQITMGPVSFWWDEFQARSLGLQLTFSKEKVYFTSQVRKSLFRQTLVLFNFFSLCVSSTKAKFH